MSLGHGAVAAEATAQSLDHPLARLLALGRPLVMGILNMTPDSFADAQRFLAAGDALVHVREMIAAGADIIDIGGESTRPYGGATPVGAEEEWERVRSPVQTVISSGVPVSIDTMKAAVAAKALAAGAAIINDVWGLQRDPDMPRVVAEHGASVVIMHNRATADPNVDIFAEIGAFFSRSLELADRAGIHRDRIVLDPGIGFGKTPEQASL